MSFVSSDEDEDCLKNVPLPDITDMILSANIQTHKNEIASSGAQEKNCENIFPECNFDLTSEFDLADDDITDMKDKKSTDTAKNFVEKLQMFRYEDFDDDVKSKERNTLGRNQISSTKIEDQIPVLHISSDGGVGTAVTQGYSIKNVSISSTMTSEPLKRKKSCESSPTPECNFDLPEELDFTDLNLDIQNNTSNFVGSNCVKTLLSKKSRLSTGKKYRRSGQAPGQILRYSSETEFGKENSDDRDLVQMMKRRRESGSVEEKKNSINRELTAVTAEDLVNFDLGSDFEENAECESRKYEALADVSNQKEGTRKPLFSQEPLNPLASSPNIIYSSGDEVWPEKNTVCRPSLSSADEIEEPEEFLRKVKEPVRKKLKKKSEGSGNKSRGRVSLSLGPPSGSRSRLSNAGNNSDDDFL